MNATSEYYKNEDNYCSHLMAAPILKWAGGKRGLIPNILGLFLSIPNAILSFSK